MMHPKGTVFFHEEGWRRLSEYLKQNQVENVFLILDKHTEIHCLPVLFHNLNKELSFRIISIPCGEENKNLSTTIFAWEELARMGADKGSLIINLGGGMVTDLGGFVASTYKRGIPFVHIPTSLLAMVDAAIGGKTGIDFKNIKNQIGTVELPAMILIDPEFLGTLPKNQLKSGMAEVIKHSIIKGEDEWNRIKEININELDKIKNVIPQSIAIKERIVKIDPYEKQERKILNYGHTLGHAIESHFIIDKTKSALLHGEAIAIGMILETYISCKQVGFHPRKLEDFANYVLSMFAKQLFNEKDIREIINLTRFDKKNSNGEVRFVLMEDYGKFIIDSTVSEKLIRESFDFYLGL